MRKIILLLTTLVAMSCAAISSNSFADSAQESPASVSTESGKININTADAATLSNILKGVGLKKAEAIVQYRENYGPFHNIQELAEVSGIGKSTVEKNAGLIAVK